MYGWSSVGKEKGISHGNSRDAPRILVVRNSGCVPGIPVAYSIDHEAPLTSTENMSSTKLFGTDGIRARAGEYPLNSRAIVAIGRAIGERLGGNVLVGQDTRVSSPWIFNLLEQGISSTKASITNAGVIPTPAIALLTK